MTTVTSTPVLRRTLRWSAGITVGLAFVGACIGWLLAAERGLISAITGVVLTAVFLAITAISLLVANRWYGSPLYVPIFFAIVLGSWLAKFILFFITLTLLRGQNWIEPMIFFVAVVISVLTTLVLDTIILLRSGLVRRPGSGHGPADPMSSGQARASTRT
ncbi:MULTISPECIES: hypothetical protein [Micrococcales]|uniref:ATP synthase protein I n=2 Tax=Micrococcales TaxID=85006 RepID=A0AAJ5VAT7_MICMQ|nr:MULTISPECIES: hypothetical protein [Micrococcales]AMG82895.1 hypothetical protein AXH82_05500 [Microbacterium sp. PAMC 28756]MDR6268462.1 hypothetical protein [Arthrobacter russicus]WEF20838.1 hypothetical protein PWF71_16345 [Microbacterium liquefaciens]